MYPFNLRRALSGETVITRLARPVRRVVGRFPEIAGEEKLIIIDDTGDVMTYSDDGVFDTRRNGSSASVLDLFMANPE